MKSVYLDGLNLTNAAAGYYVTVPIEGLEAMAISTSTYNRAGEDGIRIVTAYMRERRIGFSGMLRATCASDHLIQRRVVASLVPPVRGNDNLLTEKALRLVDDDDMDYTIFVEVNQLLMPRQNVLNSRYQFDLLAHDHAIYSTAEKTVTLNPAALGGFSLPVTLPFSFSGGEDGTETATNAGNMDTYPTIRLTGPLTNPRIENITTGRGLQLNLTVNAGSYVDIDMKNKTIVQAGVTNRIAAMTDDSKWFWLQSGANTLTLNTSVSGEAGNAVVTWRDAYAGI